MVTFDHKNYEYTLTIRGDYSEYLQQLKAIIRLVAIQEPDKVDKDASYYALSLVEDMLPSEEQMALIAKQTTPNLPPEAG